MLSWASLGQRGNHHVNNHGNAYVREKMRQLGYFLNETLTSLMRGDETLRRYKSTNKSAAAWAPWILPASGPGVPPVLRRQLEQLESVGKMLRANRL